MEALIISKKTGFKNNKPLKPVIIRDFRGKMFYSTEGIRKVEKFNLPAGSYQVEKGDITVLSRPVKFGYIPLPKKERNLKPPHDFTVMFGANPHKCTINWSDKTILFDTSLLDKTIPELFFILYHEFGHSLYKSEKGADTVAANIMLSKGYNPSQIGLAPITSLSHRQIKRKKSLTKKIINHANRLENRGIF